ncbi:PiggyBac transposable element-derived protein [Trichinella spiralis]|uniref:PiggyBac transposable element-derived protein n=1 Tax=Trichinella spiralis TaxID=6334 RepID=A0ABR3KNU5_TRISP
MDFDTVFRETRSGRNVRQIIVLPDHDVSEPDTVSEDELDRTFKQSHSSSDDEVIEEDDASANARRKSYIWRRRPFNPKTEAFIESDEEIPRNTIDNDKVVMDRSHPDYDRFYKIRSLIESICKTCLEETPGELRSVDEHIILYKGRCKMNYAWNMQIYTGKPSSGTREKNQGMRVVLDMVKGLKGHNVTCDNFFASYSLGVELRKKNLTLVGTVKKNKPELPWELLHLQGRELNSTRFAFSEDFTIVSYVLKKNKNFLVLSTMHNGTRVSDGKGSMPDIILHYNNTKGGVHNLDKMTSTYFCQRMTARWPLIVFYTIIDVSAYNAYVLWTEKHPTWNAGRLHKRRLFLEELGKALVQPEMIVTSRLSFNRLLL